MDRSRIILYNLLNLEDKILFKGERSVTPRKFKPNFSGVFWHLKNFFSFPRYFLQNSGDELTWELLPQEFPSDPRTTPSPVMILVLRFSLENPSPDYQTCKPFSPPTKGKPISIHRKIPLKIPEDSPIHIKTIHAKILHASMQYFQVGHYFPKCHFWSRNVWVKLCISINSDKFRGWIFLHSLHFIFWSQTHLSNFWPTSFVRPFSCLFEIFKQTYT